MVLYKVPFPDDYVLEVGQRRVVLRYKGHERVVFSPGIFLRAFLCLCSSDFFLFAKKTSERCFSTVVAG